MSSARKSYLRLINKKDSKILLIAKLESLRSVINSGNYKPYNRYAMSFVDDMTYDIISMLIHNFDKYSTLFDLKAHDKKYYVDKLDEARTNVINNMQEVLNKLFNDPNKINEVENSKQDIVGRDFSNIGQQFLTSLETITKYSVDDIIKNWREILK